MKLGEKASPIDIPAGVLALVRGGKVTLQKFDREDADALDRWSMKRARARSAANPKKTRAGGSPDRVARDSTRFPVFGAN